MFDKKSEKEIGSIYYIKLENLFACAYSADNDYFFKYDCLFEKKECITLVKYIGDNMYEELYTGVSLRLLQPEKKSFGIILAKDQFEKEYRTSKTDVNFEKKFNELIENPLFITEVYEVNEETKTLLGAQIDMKLQEEILEAYEFAKENLKKCYKEILFSAKCNYLNLAYGENVLYDFQKGMNRNLKKKDE